MTASKMDPEERRLALERIQLDELIRDQQVYLARLMTRRAKVSAALEQIAVYGRKPKGPLNE